MKFDIHILRKKNPYWTLNNDLHLYSYLFLLLKGFIIASAGISLGVCLLSIGIWVFLRSMKGGAVNPPQRLTERIFYDYVLVNDLSVAVSLIFSDQEAAFNSWLLAFGVLVVYGSVEIYLFHKGHFIIPVCKSHPQLFINSFFQY